MKKWAQELVIESEQINNPKYSFKQFTAYSLRKESLTEIFEKTKELQKFIRERSKHDSSYYKDTELFRFLTVVTPGSPVNKISAN